MKVGRQYLDKIVEIQWMDPNFDRIDDVDKMRRGRAALATWREYGIVFDITDGVVLIVHSAASLPSRPVDEVDEVCRTAIPEALIEKITVFEPMTVQP